MEKDKGGKSYYVDKATVDTIQKIADERFDGSASMALRWLVTEYVYMSARFVALGRSTSGKPEPTAEIKYTGEGVA